MLVIILSIFAVGFICGAVLRLHKIDRQYGFSVSDDGFFNEIRLDDKRKPDDIAIKNVHLERLDNGVWWLAIYFGKKRTTFKVVSKSAINVVAEENELGTIIIERQ